MVRKTIQYQNIDGELVSEEHYFHLSKADVIRMEVSSEGALEDRITRISSIQGEPNREERKLILQTFEDLVRQSYGQRSAEGRFVRDPKKAEEFMASEAYSELFMELITDSEAAAQFINAVMPKGLEETAAKITANANGASGATTTAAETVSLPAPDLTVTPETPRVLTQQEIIEMDSDELKSGLAAGKYKLS